MLTASTTGTITYPRVTSSRPVRQGGLTITPYSYPEIWHVILQNLTGDDLDDGMRTTLCTLALASKDLFGIVSPFLPGRLSLSRAAVAEGQLLRLGMTGDCTTWVDRLCTGGKPSIRVPVLWKV